MSSRTNRIIANIKKIIAVKSVPSDPRCIIIIPFWNGWIRLKKSINKLDNIKNSLYAQPGFKNFDQMIILACDYINWLNGIRKKRLQDYAPHIKLMMEQNGYK